MAIAFDLATDLGNGSTGTLTHSHTITGSNTLLIVATSFSSSTDTVTGVTWGGVAMTTNGSLKSAYEGTAYDCKIWYLFGAATGTANVIVTSGAGSNTYAVASSYTGVGSNAIDNQITGITAALTLTPINNNCWAIMAGNNSDGNSTAGTNTTNRISTASGMYLCDNNANIPTPTSTTLTQMGGGGHFSGVMISIFAGIIITVADTAGTPIENVSMTEGAIVSASDVSGVSSESVTIKFGWQSQSKSNGPWSSQTKS